jgi:hypothetical protein
MLIRPLKFIFVISLIWNIWQNITKSNCYNLRVSLFIFKKNYFPNLKAGMKYFTNYTIPQFLEYMIMIVAPCY